MSIGPYETAQIVNEYLLFHYGRPEEILPFPFGPVEALHFAERVVTQTFDLASMTEGSRALDLGCAVGASSFVLSRYCGEVIGIDASRAFIGVADELSRRGERPYERREEGEIASPLVARLPAGARPDRVRFETGDAVDLREDLGTFDCLLAANLVCRLPRPDRLLERLPDLVKPGGQLVISSPYTWLEAFTDRADWLGGFVRDEQPVFTLARLKTFLGRHFALEAIRDLPFLIREHARKYQWSVSQATRWRRLDV